MKFFNVVAAFAGLISFASASPVLTGIATRDVEQQAPAEITPRGGNDNGWDYTRKVRVTFEKELVITYHGQTLVVVEALTVSTYVHKQNGNHRQIRDAATETAEVTERNTAVQILNLVIQAKEEICMHGTCYQAAERFELIVKLFSNH